MSQALSGGIWQRYPLKAILKKVAWFRDTLPPRNFSPPPFRARSAHVFSRGVAIFGEKYMSQALSGWHFAEVRAAVWKTEIRPFYSLPRSPWRVNLRVAGAIPIKQSDAKSKVPSRTRTTRGKCYSTNDRGKKNSSQSKTDARFGFSVLELA